MIIASYFDHVRLDWQPANVELDERIIRSAGRCYRRFISLDSTDSRYSSMAIRRYANDPSAVIFNWSQKKKMEPSAILGLGRWLTIHSSRDCERNTGCVCFFSCSFSLWTSSPQMGRTDASAMQKCCQPQRWEGRSQTREGALNRQLLTWSTHLSCRATLVWSNWKFIWIGRPNRIECRSLPSNDMHFNEINRKMPTPSETFKLFDDTSFPFWWKFSVRTFGHGASTLLCHTIGSFFFFFHWKIHDRPAAMKTATAAACC